jgi:two-component system response regulator HydG
VDVRVIAATNRDLEASVRAGGFRTDLFYRLRVVVIALPPLRERREDIPLLVAHFLGRSAAGGGVRGIEPDALASLLQRPWPGNVRELQNAIEAATALARGPRLTLLDLRPAQSEACAEAVAAAPDGLELSLAAWERACIEATLARVGGDVRKAAALLGVGRSTLYRKLRQKS